MSAEQSRGYVTFTITLFFLRDSFMMANFSVFRRPSNPEAWDRVQLRELKNGRLAMIAIAGMIAQESISGLGVLQRGDPYAGFV